MIPFAREDEIACFDASLLQRIYGDHGGALN